MSTKWAGRMDGARTATSASMLIAPGIHADVTVRALLPSAVWANPHSAICIPQWA